MDTTEIPDLRICIRKTTTLPHRALLGILASLFLACYDDAGELAEASGSGLPDSATITSWTTSGTIPGTPTTHGSGLPPTSSDVAGVTSSHPTSSTSLDTTGADETGASMDDESEASSTDGDETDDDDDPSCDIDAGEVECQGRCIDPATDPRHCGASGRCEGSEAGQSCGANQACREGECREVCFGSWLDCNGRCVDPQSDNDHCGATLDCTGPQAGERCEPPRVCTQGMCAENCAAGQILCSGRCVDPLTDRQHCGSAGDCSGANAGTVCEGGQSCKSGACVDDAGVWDACTWDNCVWEP